MKSATKFLVLPLLAATATDAQACGNFDIGPGLALLLLGVMMAPGFLYGLITGCFPNLSYGKSLGGMLGLIFLILFLMGAGEQGSSGFWGSMLFIGGVSSAGHAIGMAIMAGLRRLTPNQPDAEAQPQPEALSR